MYVYISGGYRISERGGGALLKKLSLPIFWAKFLKFYINKNYILGKKGGGARPRAPL